MVSSTDNQFDLGPVLDALPDHVAILSPDGTILGVNEAWRRFARDNGGDAATSYVGSSYLDAIRVIGGATEEGDLETLRRDLMNLLRGEGRSFTFEYPCHSPEARRWFVLQASPLPANGAAAVLSHKDITHRRLAEEAVQDRSRRQEFLAEFGQRGIVGVPLQDLLDEAVSQIATSLSVECCGVWQATPDGRRLLLCSEYGTDVRYVGHVTIPADETSPVGTAYLRREVVRVEDIELDPRYALSSKRCAGKSAFLSVVIPGEEAPHGVIDVRARTTRRFTNDDVDFIRSLAHVLGMIIDARHRSARLLEQESLARLGAMSAILAHEVRNPLAGLRFTLDVLRSGDGGSGAEAELIDLALSRIAELDGRLDDILSYAEPQAPAKVRVGVRRLLANVDAMINDDPGFEGLATQISIDRDFDIDGDPVQLASAFFQLCQNAAQSMNGAGHLDIRVTREVVDDRELCVIEFADTGPGIDDELRERVFEPFFTTRTRGAGLGLAFTRRCVEDHGGDITLRSPPSGGTVVVVRLPVGAV